MNHNAKTLQTILAASLLMAMLSSCSEKVATSSNSDQSNVSSALEARARQATPNEARWEYLVVSFGKTSFDSIESNIKSGNSKLVAFQEFADLLSGYEGINLQTKLDMLGRFGWELVTTIGQIGGDQQLFFRRNRYENRIEIEKEAIKNLTTILRDESAKKEKRLKDYLAEIERSKAKLDEQSQAGLIDLDAKERRDREREAGGRAKAELTANLTSVASAFQKKTKLKSIDVSIAADESNANRMLYKGKITIELDATEALLFEGNKYRATKARELREDFRQHLLRSAKMKPKTLSDFNVVVAISINHNQTTTTVANSSDSVGLDGYKGYWDYN
jgi:hypothetical protein